VDQAAVDNQKHGWRREMLESVKVDFNLDRVKNTLKVRKEQRRENMITDMKKREQEFMASLGFPGSN
jgi:hypothetical protein